MLCACHVHYRVMERIEHTLSFLAVFAARNDAEMSEPADVGEVGVTGFQFQPVTDE